MSDTTIAVFARAPVAGRTKTRLIPLLGAADAAQLQMKLTERAVITACEARCGDVMLWCDPSADDPELAACIARHAIVGATQCDGDLGLRMRHATRNALASSNRVLLIGTDCPALTPQNLIDARNALDCHDAVITPAEDGGYVLLGLKHCPAEIFSGVNWGSEHVLAQTRDRLATLRWSWHEQPALWDVDRPADFERLVASELMPGIAATRAHV